MKKIKLLTYILFVTLISVTASSCEGEAGPAGSDGSDGNANVQVGTMNLTSSDWLWRANYTFSTGPGGTTAYFSRYVDIDIPEITTSIQDTGLVLAYYQPYTSEDSWETLPFQFTSFGGTYITNIAYRSEVSKIRLFYFWTPNGSPTPSGLETHNIADSKIKYVIIEGNAIGARVSNPQQAIYNELEQAGVDISNYSAVCNYYGINP